MKKWLSLILLFLPSLAFAQFPGGTPTNPVGANLAVQDSGSCSTLGSYLWQKLPTNAGTTTVNLAGTFSGTVTVRESNNGGGSWTTAGTQTAVGTSSYSTNGFTDICADVTTYTSGTFNVTISTGLQQIQSLVASGGGTLIVSSNPATCTAGQTFYNTTTGQFLTCTAANTLAVTGSAGGPSGATVQVSTFCPPGNANNCYQVYADGHNVCDASVTSASHVVTSATANFLGVDSLGRPNAVVGGIVWAVQTNSGPLCPNGPSRIGVTATLAQTTITSIDSNTQIHVAGTGISTATSSLWWFSHDDTVQQQAARKQAYQTYCGTEILNYSGYSLVQSPPENGLTQNTTCGAGNLDYPESTRLGPQVIGLGPNQTVVVFSPTTIWNTASSGTLSEGFTGSYLKGFTLTGTDCTIGSSNCSAAIASGQVVSFIGTTFNAEVRDVFVLGLNSSGTATNLDCFFFTTQTVLDDVQCDGAGPSGTNGASLYVTIQGQSFFGDYAGAQADLTLAANAQVVSLGNNFGFGGGGQANVGVNAGAYFWSFGDQFNGRTGNSGGGVSCFGNCFLYAGSALGQSNGSNQYGVNVGNASILTIQGMKATASGTGGIAINPLSGSKVYDLGGNSFTGTSAISNAGTWFQGGTDVLWSGTVTGIAPTCAFTTGGGTSPSCAVQAGSTNEKGVIIASTGTGSPGSSGTITLTFAGTFSGPTAAAPACHYTLDNSGTAWGAESLVFVSTQSTTAPVLAWTNINAIALAALTVSSPYRIDYICAAR